MRKIKRELPPVPGLKSIPSVVQLPGGVRLRGVAFRVIDYDSDGRPRTFEILPPGAPANDGGRGVWTLFADEGALRRPGQGTSAAPASAVITGAVAHAVALGADQDKAP